MDVFSEQKMCSNCHKTDSTETWRVVKNLTYCNACGIYLRDHNVQRPQRLVEQSAARRATKRALVPEPSAMSSLQPASQEPLRRTQSALAPAIVRSLQDYRTLSGFALQGYAAHDDLMDTQPSLQEFTEELRRSKRSRTRSPILDDIFEDEQVDLPSRGPRTSHHLEEDDGEMLLQHAEPSQSGSDVSAETPYAHCASQADGSLLEDELGCTHMLSSLSEAEQAEVAAGCLLFMKAVALDALQQADLTRASRRVNVYLSSKVCHNCGTTNTPLWRKYQGLDMCNACGVYPTQREHPGAMRDPSRAVKPKGPSYKPTKSGPVRATSGPNTPRGWITAYKPEDEPVPELPPPEAVAWGQ